MFAKGFHWRREEKNQDISQLCTHLMYSLRTEKVAFVTLYWLIFDIVLINKSN